MGLTRPRAYQIFDIDYKQSVRVVTVSSVTLGGGAPSTVDGVSLSLNDRILVTAQSTGSQNGLYYVTTVGTGSNGTWARSIDGNETGEIDAGMVVMVTEGTTYADTQWKLTTNDPIVIGSTALTFVQNYLANSISSGTSNVVVTANSNVSIAVAGSNSVVFSSGVQNITANIIPTANITYALGNTTNRFKDIWLANSSIYLGNVTISADSTQLLVNGTNVVTSSGGTTSLTGNITGGNLITGGLVTATGNITGGNVRTGGLISATGNITGGNLTVNTDAVITGNLTVNGTTITVNSNTVTINDKFINVANNASTSTLANGGGLGVGPVGTEYATLTYDQAANTWDTNIGVAVTGIISATGNITGGNILGGANVNATTHTGTTVSVTANITGGNILTSGLISATGNITGGNILGGANVNATTHTGTTVSVTANITGGNLISSALVQGVTVSASGNVIGGNISTAGLITATGNITGGNVIGTTLTGTLSTAAQTNITSVGTLSSLAVTGNISGGNILGGANVNATTHTGTTVSVTGNVTGGNIVTAGTISTTGNAYVGNILTNGYYYANGVVFGGGGGGVPGGANTQIQFNDNGAFNGTAGFTFNKTTNAIATTGAFSTTGNITGGNLSGTNIVGTLTTAAQTNITSLGTLGSLAVTGNITSGNLSGTRGVFTNIAGTLETAAQTNITSVGTLGSLTVTDNVQGGNLRTAGLISATGAITGAAITGSSLTVTTGNITAGNLLISGAIIDSGQLDIQTSAGNANVVITPNGTGNLNVTTGVSVTGNITGGNLYGTLRTAAQTAITSVGTLSSLAVTANITGGNLLTGGLVSATGNITGGNIITSGSGGNITGANVISATTIGTTQILNTGANGTGNIGSSTTYFNTVFAKATSAQYADLAEMYSADAEYAPGTVVEFGGNQEITISSGSHSTQVAGIISTNPSYLMNSAQSGEYVLAVALTGRVPCQVVGTIYKGDRLVADSTAGVATALNKNLYEPGCIIGKALENYDSNIVGIIEVAVGRF